MRLSRTDNASKQPTRHRCTRPTKLQRSITKQCGYMLQWGDRCRLGTRMLHATRSRLLWLPLPLLLLLEEEEGLR